MMMLVFNRNCLLLFVRMIPHRLQRLGAKSRIFVPNQSICGLFQAAFRPLTVCSRNMFIRLCVTTLGLAILLGCNGDIYLRNGVSNGDTFYLAPRALADPEPALQSWVSYSLSISACQLQLGGDNPARASSFACELSARRLLLDTWVEKEAENPQVADDYLDDLVLVGDAGYLAEYVAFYFQRPHWEIPRELQIPDFKAWRRSHLSRHKPRTQLAGSWNYASRVRRR